MASRLLFNHTEQLNKIQYSTNLTLYTQTYTCTKKIYTQILYGSLYVEYSQENDKGRTTQISVETSS